MCATTEIQTMLWSRCVIITSFLLIDRLLKKKVKTIVRHKKYRSKTMDSDIAILTLDRSVRFTKIVQVKVRLWVYDIYQGTACILSIYIQPPRINQMYEYKNVHFYKCSANPAASPSQRVHREKGNCCRFKIFLKVEFPKISIRSVKHPYDSGSLKTVLK